MRTPGGAADTAPDSQGVAVGGRQVEGTEGDQTTVRGEHMEVAVAEPLEVDRPGVLERHAAERERVALDLLQDPFPLAPSGERALTAARPRRSRRRPPPRDMSGLVRRKARLGRVVCGERGLAGCTREMIAM